MMSRVNYGDTIQFHLTQKLADGTEIGSTVGRNPLKAIVGDEESMPGLEDVVIGMKPGERRTQKIPSLYFVGPYNEKLIMKIDPDQLPPGVKPRIGIELALERERQHIASVRIKEDSVTIDANHPLAGKNLVLDIRLVNIL
jgi:FKBP-type peptidyl-prolyl cis-trans isomerase 2